MEPALTLANTPLDLQVTICMFLHPSDILALRKTCKALELATRRRIVWVAVLHRVCLDNTIFLPSFPIPDMSDLELERAAMAPRRWIELCAASHIQHSNDSSERLHPRTTRIIRNYVNSLFIVPGGRYLVTSGEGISVWDLGYVSTVDCKLVASAGLEDDFKLCMVQATSDGKGLVILSLTFGDDQLSIFEIYPQSEKPLLTQIAHLDRFSSEEYPTHLLPDTLVCRDFHDDRIVFRVVDYRTNHSTCFSADIDVNNIGSESIQTIATKTAIIVFCKEGILIWAIPPLSPQSPDHFLDNNPTHILPLFKIPFPDGIVRHPHEIVEWMTVSSWYFGSLESVYFDILYTDSKLQRFKIIIKPDLSDASLHVMNTSEIISDDLVKSLAKYRHCDGYRICEDAFVYFWNNRLKSQIVFTGLILTSAPGPFTNLVARWNGHINALCPTSGRLVYCMHDDDGCRIDVVDLL